MTIDPNSHWYYSRDGGQAGPFAFTQMREMANAGQLQPTDLIWTEGMAERLPIHQSPLFAQTGGGAPAMTAPPNPYAAGQSPFTPNPNYNSYYSGAVPGRGPSQQGMATAGFVLSFLFPLLGLIFSIIALNGMKKNQNDEGKSLATAGLIISIVFVSISCIVACVWMVVVIGIVGASAAHS